MDCHDLQLVDVVVFDVDVKVVLLQQAVHTGLQPADVLLHLVIVHSWWRTIEERLKLNNSSGFFFPEMWCVVIICGGTSQIICGPFRDRDAGIGCNEGKNTVLRFKAAFTHVCISLIGQRWRHMVHPGPAAPWWMVRTYVEKDGCRIFEGNFISGNYTSKINR